MATNEAATVIFLDSPDKWEDWELKFKAQVVSFDLTNQVFNNRAFLDKPVKPTRPILWDVTTRTQAGVQTRALSATATPDTNTAAMAAAINAINAANAITKEDYKFEYLEYQEDLKAYNH